MGPHFPVWVCRVWSNNGRLGMPMVDTRLGPQGRSTLKSARRGGPGMEEGAFGDVTSCLPL